MRWYNWNRIQGREFYNKLLQEWLDNNDVFMYCTAHALTTKIY